MAWFEDILSPFVCPVHLGHNGQPQGGHPLSPQPCQQRLQHWSSYWLRCRGILRKHSNPPPSTTIVVKKQVHRICCSVPFYHCFGNVAGTLASLLHGASLIVPCPRLTSYDGAFHFHCLFLCVKNVCHSRC